MSDRIRTPSSGFSMVADRSVTESRSFGLLRSRGYPSWFKLATEKLKAAGTLQDNWDSYGGLRTNSLSLHHAFQFLDRILRTTGITEPLIAVNGKGNICFEWDLQGSSMELEVLPSGKVSYYFVDAQGVEEEGEEGSEFRCVRDHLTRL